MDSNDSRRLSSSSYPIPYKSDAFQDMTAFSPPSHDPSWVIQYPKKEKKNLGDNNNEKDTNMKFKQTQIFNENHLDHCKKFIVNNETVIKSNKSLGTDDGFKSAVCSSQLLKVAEKMMINNEFVKANIDDNDDDFEISKIANNEKTRMDFDRHNGNRRGSRSLPASPKLDRKINPYFTITKNSQPSASNISFLTNLFGITAKRDISNSNVSLSSQNIDYDKPPDSKNIEPRPSILSPKPNELREMNFWTPTSM
ncbi:unnamed protein product [Diamesa serratosioi]